MTVKRPMSYALTIIEADLGNPVHAEALVGLLDTYVSDPMELGQPLDERVRREVVPGLRAHPACYVFLAYDGAKPVGFSICFLGFSTFQARPLLNIHDLFVIREMRGRGLGRRLLERVEAKARELKCCRLTLEVREDNRVARSLYRKFGFADAAFGPSRVRQEFWVKVLG